MDKVVNKNYQRTEKELYDYEFLKKYISLRRKDLEELVYEGVSGTALSEDSISTNRISDPVAKEFFKIEKISEAWRKEIKKNESKVNKINVAVGLLNDIEKSIIEKKYFKCLRIYEIAKDLDYSEKQISRIKKNAINKISIVLWGNDEMSDSCP